MDEEDRADMPAKPKAKAKSKSKCKAKAKSKSGKRSKMIAEVEAPTEEVVPPGANDREVEAPVEEVLPPGANDCEVEAAVVPLVPKANKKRKSGSREGTPDPVPKPVKAARTEQAPIPTMFARRYMPAKPGLSRARWQAIRVAFNKNIHKKLECPSKHEDFDANDGGM